MFDIRYHIIALVASFLALGIGVLVGSMLGGDEVLVREQKQIIDRLEEDFKYLRQENQQTRKEIEFS